MKAKGYSYIRFSTKDQLKGNSQTRQAEGADRWCAENKVELVQTYRDLGVSGFRGKNAATGALSEFLKLVETGRIPTGSYLIVESLDRLSRMSILEALELFQRLVRAGVKVVTLMDGQVYDRETISKNPIQLIISITIMSRAHEESATKGHRVARAWDAKRAKITTEKLTAKCPRWLRLAPDRKSFEIIPERAALVRRIYEMSANGSGNQHILREVQKLGVKPWAGYSKAWYKSTIKRILESRAVIGEFAPCLRRNGERKELDPIPGYFPAVVSPELAAAVWQIRRERSVVRGRTGEGNIFSKLAFDAETGSPMSKTPASKGYNYLVPSAAKNRLAPYSAWNYRDFKKCFLRLCERAALERPKISPEGGGALVVKRQELADTDKQIARLVDFLARGASVSVEERLRELERQKSAVRGQIEALENDLLAKRKDVSEVDWNDTVALRENLCATVKRITIDACKKWFRAEFFDGQIYELQREKDGGVTIKSSSPLEPYILIYGSKGEPLKRFAIDRTQSP